MTMKNVFLGILVGMMCFAYSPNTHAQDEAGFAPKHFYVDLGVGVPGRYNNLGLYNTYNYSYYRLPSFTANLQYGFDMFSAGLYLGYTHYGNKYNASYYYYDDKDDYYSGLYDYHTRTSRIGVGVSFSWHIWYFLNHKLDLGLGVESLDLYATAIIGGNIKSQMDDTPKYGKRTVVSGGPMVGAKVGAKYYFLKNLGAFLEVGGGYNSISYATVGLALKF